MKKLFLFLCLVVLSVNVFGQSFPFGLKIGSTEAEVRAKMDSLGYVMGHMVDNICLIEVGDFAGETVNTSGFKFDNDRLESIMFMYEFSSHKIASKIQSFLSVYKTKYKFVDRSSFAYPYSRGDEYKYYRQIGDKIKLMHCTDNKTGVKIYIVNSSVGVTILYRDLELLNKQEESNKAKAVENI